MRLLLVVGDATIETFKQKSIFGLGQEEPLLWEVDAVFFEKLGEFFKREPDLLGKAGLSAHLF